MDNYLKWWQACFFVIVGIFIGVIVSGKFILLANREADSNMLRANALSKELKSSVNCRKEMDDRDALLLAASICTSLASEEPIIAYIPNDNNSVTIPEDYEIDGAPAVKSLSVDRKELGGYDKEHKGEK